MFKRVVAVLVSFALIGCTSMHRIGAVSYGEVSRKLESGDTVTIVDMSGRGQFVTVASIERDGIYVVTPQGNKLISFSEISEIRYEKVSAAKTAGVGAVGVVVTLMIVLLAGAALMSDLGSE